MSSKPNTCQYCGEELPKQQGTGGHRKYCSEVCKRKANSLRWKNGIRPRAEAYIKICKQCNKTFIAYREKQLYCSRECMWECYKEEGFVLRKANHGRICKWCGKEFIMGQQSAKGRNGEVQEGQFCSRECRGLWRRSQPKKNYSQCRVYFKECEVCGEMFTARRPNVKYCSDECKYEIMKQYQRIHYKANWTHPEPFKCKECGRLHQPKFGDTSRVFCSSECSKKAQSRRKDKNRAIYFNVKYEPINPLKVFKRDQWHCQICGKATPKKNRGTRYSNAPELDHRIPMSKGGDHLYSNVQCACRKCNGWKSNNNEVGQIPLFEVKSMAYGGR